MRHAAILALALSLDGWLAISAPAASIRIDERPLAQSIAREAARLSAAVEPEPLVAPAAMAEPTESRAWARVRRLAPGTEIRLEVAGATPITGLVLAVDNGAVTIVRLDEPTLNDRERGALRDVAVSHPSSFLLEPGSAGRSFLPSRVRVAWNGLFIADRRVGDLDRFVTSTPRSRVSRVETTARVQNAVGCALASYYRGALIGGLPGALLGGAVGRDSGPTLVGMTIGWAVGGMSSYARCRHVPARVVYTAL